MNSAAMRPLADWTLEDRRHITGVFTDIDDTLTTDGAITAGVLAGAGGGVLLVVL